VSTLRQYPRKLAGVMFFFAIACSFVLTIAAGAQAQANPPDGGGAGVGGAGAEQAQSPAIVGGREALPGAWPWQVALVNRFSTQAYNGFFCGGTLVAPQWVLTAAHCVDGSEPTLIDVLVGAHRLSENSRRVQADMAIVYPGYNEYGVDGDLALLHLSEPVTQTPISLFALDGITTEMDYMRGTVTGWGDMDPLSWFGEFPDALRELSMPLVDRSVCNERWFLGITENLLCAGYPNMPNGACYGDSGGPLMVQDGQGQWLQVGIVSFGVRFCVGSNRPDVFTRVATYGNWIQGCIADPNSSECLGADQYEPDSYAVDAQYLTTLGVTQTHTFHESGDQDWLKFDVKAGNLYVIQTHVYPTYTTAVDTLVWLFDDQGRTPLAYNDDDGGVPPVAFLTGPVRDAQLAWKAKADGQLYASIENIASTVGSLPTYGAGAQYSVVVNEFVHQSYMPSLQRALPPPSPTSSFEGFPTPIFPFSPIVVTVIPLPTPVPITTPVP
jgi:secreted trypsin-like serine protease